MVHHSEIDAIFFRKVNLDNLLLIATSSNSEYVERFYALKNHELNEFYKSILRVEASNENLEILWDFAIKTIRFTNFTDYLKSSLVTIPIWSRNIKWPSINRFLDTVDATLESESTFPLIEAIVQESLSGNSKIYNHLEILCMVAARHYSQSNQKNILLSWLTGKEVAASFKKIRNINFYKVSSLLHKFQGESVYQSEFRLHYSRYLNEKKRPTKIESFLSYLINLSEENEINPFNQYWFLNPMPRSWARSQKLIRFLEKSNLTIFGKLRSFACPRLKLRNESFSSRREESTIPENPKVAVLISGQLRSYKTHLHKLCKLFSEAQFDIFLSTWQFEGKKGFDNIDHASRLFEGEMLDGIISAWSALGEIEFRDRYPSLFRNEFRNNILTPREISQEIEISESSINISAEKAMLTNPEKMYDRMFDVSNRINFSDYDAVIRIRPDFILESKLSSLETLIKKTLTDRFIYVDYCSYKLFGFRFGVIVGDSFAFGPSDLMKHYFRNINSAWSEFIYVYGRPLSILPHNNLAWTLLENQVRTQKFPESCRIANFERDEVKTVINDLKIDILKRIDSNVHDNIDMELLRVSDAHLLNL